MKLMTVSVIAWSVVALTSSLRGSDAEQVPSVIRDNLSYVELPNGSRLTISTMVFYPERPHATKVWIALYPKGGGGKSPRIWSTSLGSMDYAPTTKYHYALAKVMEDRIFVFCIWDGRHFTLDRRTGELQTKGAGDDVLRNYDNLMPLKLTLRRPSTGHTMTEKESQDLEKEQRQAEREASAVSRVQSIPGSPLMKHYIIQFDRPGLERRPLFVIVWKASRFGRSSLGHLDRAVATISINSHTMTPSRAKKAVYALQPDYSLKELPLTEEEIARLFSHITRSEQRDVSSDQIELLPTDPFWEQKVDPYLKIVEPPHKQAK
jgi:hypothetical protein